MLSKKKMKTKHKNQEKWTRKEKNFKQEMKKNINKTYVCPIYFFS